MLEGAGLTAQPSDCHFGMFECTYLGHVVGKGIAQPEPSKVQAVMTFPVPILHSPDFEKLLTALYVLQTDVSDCGVGAVLSQKNKARDNNPIAYFSKKLQQWVFYMYYRKRMLGNKAITNHCSLVWMDKIYGQQFLVVTSDCISTTIQFHRASSRTSQ